MNFLRRLAVRKYHGLCDISPQYAFKRQTLSPYEKQFPAFVNVPPVVRQDLYNNTRDEVENGDLEAGVHQLSKLLDLISPAVLTEEEVNHIVLNPTRENFIQLKKDHELKGVLVSTTNLKKLGLSILEMELNKLILKNNNSYEWENIEMKSKTANLKDSQIIHKTITKLGIRHSVGKDSYKSMTMLLLLLDLKYSPRQLSEFIESKYLPVSYQVISEEFI